MLRNWCNSLGRKERETGRDVRDTKERRQIKGMKSPGA